MSGKTELYLDDGAQAFVAEILTPGRIGRAERFAYERVRSELPAFWCGRLSVWDPLLLEPAR
ncbi:MAG: urease accessory protein UreD [Hydrogenibacillus schlegelii]|nr:urease accessory protein UreD [Hydrogenibacillus schlegelii]